MAVFPIHVVVTQHNARYIQLLKNIMQHNTRYKQSLEKESVLIQVLFFRA